MVTSKKQVRPRRPSSAHDKVSTEAPRQRRGIASELANEQDKQEEKKLANIPSGSNQRRNPSKKGSEALKIGRKGKPLSPAVVDVVFGKVQTYMPNKDELRMKKKEDALRCGRVLRTVRMPSLPSSTRLSTGFGSNIKILEVENREKVSSTSLFTGAIANHAAEGNIGKSAQEDGILEPPNITSILTKRSHKDSHENLLPTVNPQSNLIQRVLDISTSTDKDVEDLNQSRKLSDNAQRRIRCISPTPEHRNKTRRTKSDRNFSPERRHMKRRQMPDDSNSGSDRRHRNRKHRIYVSRSETTSPSMSPDQYRKKIDEGRTRKYKEENHIIAIEDGYMNGVRHEIQEIQKGRLRHRRRESSSTENRYRHGRSSSPYESRSRCRRSRSSSISRPELSSDRQQSLDAGIPEDSELNIVKRERVLAPSPAVDRRTRRYKQAILEADNAKRLSEGKKPFYLTVDTQGQPYGPGRAAWVAEINKLSIALDPSCTHIRKQTHESMCILKKRVDEKFDYSRDVSEDYLRALLDKAVTRRRSELIALIRADGDRSQIVGVEIWKRLQELADSKQREDKTKHARYANACRKTFGRTGSLGVNGIQEKLREVYGRSPDPEEVLKEMERYKGYGRKEDTSGAREVKRGDRYIDEPVDDESIPFPENKIMCKGNEVEEVDEDRRESEWKGSQKSRKHKNGKHHNDRDFSVDKEELGNEDAVLFSTKKLSKKEYIAHLEAELESFRRPNAKGQYSHTDVDSQSALWTRSCRDGDTGGNVA